jgi:hypothetical protein
VETRPHHLGRRRRTQQHASHAADSARDTASIKINSRKSKAAFGNEGRFFMR